MHMSFINMNGEQILILVIQKFRAKLLADFNRSFGSDLPRLKADDKVLCKDSTPASTCCCDFCKIFGSFGRIFTAHKSKNESAVVGLFWIGDICQRFFKRCMYRKYLCCCQFNCLLFDIFCIFFCKKICIFSFFIQGVLGEIFPWQAVYICTQISNLWCGYTMLAIFQSGILSRFENQRLRCHFPCSCKELELCDFYCLCWRSYCSRSLCDSLLRQVKYPSTLLPLILKNGQSFLENLQFVHIKSALCINGITDFYWKWQCSELPSVKLPSIYTSKKIEKTGSILMKNFALKSKFYLLHKNVNTDLFDMPIIWLTFSGWRCIIIGIEETHSFLVIIGICRKELV